MAKTSDSKQWILKLERFCAWQERSENEVKVKMEQLEIPSAKQSKLIEYLRDEGYLDDARYACHFVMGKFRMKKWGRIKIRHALEAKSIPEKFIDKALNVLDKEEYELVLKQILRQKRKTLTSIKDPYQLNHKVSIYAMGRGFEPDLVWEILKGMT